MSDKHYHLHITTLVGEINLIIQSVHHQMEDMLPVFRSKWRDSYGPHCVDYSLVPLGCCEATELEGLPHLRIMDLPTYYMQHHKQHLVAAHYDFAEALAQIFSTPIAA